MEKKGNGSEIRRIHAIIDERRYRGEEVFDFSLGSPGIKPMPEIMGILEEHLRTCTFGYNPSFGKNEIRERTAEYYSKKYGVPFRETDIFFSHGATGIINILFRGIGEKGNNIVFPTPLFQPPHTIWADRAGKIPKRVRTSEDFDLDLERIEHAIDKDTCAVFVNPGNNPTGRLYSEDVLEKLGGICEEKGVYLIVDNVYEGMEWTGKGGKPWWKFRNVIEVRSLSKSYNLAGLRIGWGVIHPDLEGKDELLAKMRFIHEADGYLCPNVFEGIVPEFLSLPEERIKEGMNEYRKRVKTMVNGLKEIGYEVEEPESTFYVWFKVPESYEGDDIKFCKKALEMNTGLVPGSSFGPGGEGYVRISVGSSEIQEIEKSLDRFEKLYRGEI